jgi:hypothetical protein
MVPWGGALLVIALAFGVVAVPASAAGAKVTVCRVPKGDPRNEKTVRVPAASVDRLLASTLSYKGPCAQYGESASLGKGRLTAFSQTERSRPKVIGLLLKDSTFDGLPYEPPSSGIWCYDKDGNGTVDPHRECAGGHERALHLNPEFRSKVDTPFTYVLANWNPMGHLPPGVWDTAHFDVHFYLNDNSERLAIRPGPCPALTHCDDYPKGKIMPAERYRHPDFIDVDAVEPGMGNHLIDSKTPEMNGGRFTTTFIYGIWDGEITFYEPMVNLDRFQGLRDGTIKDTCAPIKLPRAWQTAGWYPTRYCIRHRDNRDESLATLERFVYRRAG